MFAKTRIPRTTAAALLLLLFLLTNAGSQQTENPTAPPTQRSMGSRKHYVGLENFGEVSPTLFRGGQPGADGLKALKKMGVSIIVDMRGSVSEHEKQAVDELGMKYVSIPWHCPFPKDETFARFLRLIKESRGKKIFVHCRLGDDRTGMAIAAYRMADEGWSAEQALKEMEEFGFTGVHHAICPTLKHYEKAFPEHWKTHPAFRDLRPMQAQK